MCNTCTGLVADAEFTSSGVPYNKDTCKQRCKTGYFAVGSPIQECRVCSASACAVGYVRQPCTPDADGTCTPCTTSRPAHSHYISPGPQCLWECDSAFELDAASQTCQPRNVPNLLIINRSLTTYENNGSSPASFAIVLTKRPSVQDVKVVLTSYEQLQATKPSFIVFTQGMYIHAHADAQAIFVRLIHSKTLISLCY